MALVQYPLGLSYLQMAKLIPYDCLSTSSKITPDRENSEKGSLYVDKLLETLVGEKGVFADAYIAKDAVAGFCRQYLFTANEEAILVEVPTGVLQGLKTLHRATPCYLEEIDGRLFIHALLGAGVLDFQYIGRLKIGMYYPQVLLHVTLDYLGVSLDYSIDAVTGEDGILHQIDITDLKELKISVDNYWPLNKVLNVILGGVSKIFQKHVKDFLKHQVGLYIAERLPYFKFPTEEGSNVDSASDSCSDSEDSINGDGDKEDKTKDYDCEVPKEKRELIEKKEDEFMLIEEHGKYASGMKKRCSVVYR